MKLDRYRLLHADEDHFLVHEEGKGPFAIAKRRLSPKTVKDIEQHFAEGGEVNETEEARRLRESVEAPGSFVPGPITTTDTGNDIDQRAAATPDQLGNQYGDAGRLTLPLATPTSGTQGATMIPEPPESTLAATPPAAAVQPSAPQLKLPAFPGAPSTSGLKMEEQGINAGAEAAGKQSQAEAGVLDAHEKASQAAWTDVQAQMKPLLAQREQLVKDIMSSKIDPNRLWHNSSTGQKVTASIGMILGGIGAGLTGGPNQAVHIIDQAIQRDVDAQKDNLGKKQSLLSDNLRQTQDLRGSYDLARAHGLDVASIQMRKAAAQFGTEKDRAAALATAGLIEQKRDDIMRGYTLQKYQDSYQKAVAQYTQQQQGQSAALMDAASRGLSPEDFAKLPPEHPLRKAGIPIAEDEAVTRNGKPVLDQDGNPVMHKAQRFYQAVNDKIVEKALPEFAANSETLDKVRNLKAFVAEHKSGAWSPKAIQEAKSLANDIELSWLKAQEGVGRMNENEKDMLDQMVQDPSGFFASSTGKTEQSVKDLERSVLTKREALKNTYLIRRNQ